MNKTSKVMLIVAIFTIGILGKGVPVQAQTENAWVLVDVINHPNKEGWEQANQHVSYDNEVSYKPGEFSVKTRYINRTQGRQIHGEGIRLSATFSAPPKVIYGGQEVSLTLNMEASENTLSHFQFYSSTRADFNRNINVGLGTGSGSFKDEDGAFNWRLDIHRNYKPIKKTIKDKAPKGEKTGDQMVLRQLYYQGTSMGTYYLYEWKAPTTSQPVAPPAPSKPLTPTPSQPSAQSGFSDLPSNHWAYASIMEMVDLGILAGYTDGTFKPNKTISRAEFSKILVLSLKLPEVKSTSPAFSDVATNHWAYNVIESAKPYLTGYRGSSGSMSFKPNQVAVREDVAVAIVKAKGLGNSNANLSLLNRFSDQGQISNALRNHVAIAVEQGYMTGTNIGFEPQKALTRAEACALLSRLIDRSLFEGKDKVPYS